MSKEGEGRDKVLISQEVRHFVLVVSTYCKIRQH
jgi:hypothetical protein